jgi:hypothetical protein
MVVRGLPDAGNLYFQVPGCTSYSFISVTVTSVVKLGSSVVFFLQKKRLEDRCVRQISDGKSM